jgi:hypothetical protein
VIPAAMGGSPPGKGEGGTCCKQARPQIETIPAQFSSLSAHPVKLTFPDMDFLPGRVLGILLTGRRYTSKDSWIELCHSRLSDSIWKLRRLGWPVNMSEELVVTGDAGRTASIGVYYLDAETIADAGERGQRYATECARIEAARRSA